MARVTIQMGHVPRTSGATGTWREQEFARTVGPKLRDELKRLGHVVTLIGADDAVPAGDVFVALHTDGSTNPDRRGASVGYPPAASEEGRLARAWKAAHQLQGYSGGFFADNFTAALRNYYGFRRAVGYKHEFLAEHGTSTNATDEAWLFSHIPQCVRAHVDAIGAIVGHPIPVFPPSQEVDVARLTQFQGTAPQPEFGVSHPVNDDRNLFLLTGRHLSRIENEDEFWDHWNADNMRKRKLPDGTEEADLLVLDFQSANDAVRSRAIRFARFL